jgi:hypothetical protein
VCFYVLLLLLLLLCCCCHCCWNFNHKGIEEAIRRISVVLYLRIISCSIKHLSQTKNLTVGSFVNNVALFGFLSWSFRRQSIELIYCETENYKRNIICHELFCDMSLYIMQSQLLFGCYRGIPLGFFFSMCNKSD